LALTGVSARATSPTCAYPLITALDDLPRALRFVELAGLLERRYGTDPYFQQVVEAVRNGTPAWPKLLQDDEFSLGFRFGEDDPGHLTITIGHMFQRNISEGERPPVRKSKFPRAMAAILIGVAQRVEANPGLRRVDIVADMVRNPSLPPLLRTLGFRDRWSPRYTLNTVGFAAFAGLGVILLPTQFTEASLWIKTANFLAMITPLCTWFIPIDRKLRLRLDFAER